MDIEKNLKILNFLLDEAEKEENGTIYLWQAIDMCHRLTKFFKLEKYSPQLNVEKYGGKINQETMKYERFVKRGKRRFDLFVKDLRNTEERYEVLYHTDDLLSDCVISKNLRSEYSCDRNELIRKMRFFCKKFHLNRISVLKERLNILWSLYSNHNKKKQDKLSFANTAVKDTSALHIIFYSFDDPRFILFDLFVHNEIKHLFDYIDKKIEREKDFSIKLEKQEIYVSDIGKMSTKDVFLKHWFESEKRNIVLDEVHIKPVHNFSSAYKHIIKKDEFLRLLNILADALKKSIS